MRSPRAARAGAGWALAVALLAALSAAAQPSAEGVATPAPAPAAKPEAPPAPEPIALPHVMAALEDASSRLRRIESVLAADPGIARIEAELPDRREQIRAAQRTTDVRLAEGVALRTLVELEVLWKGLAGELRGWIDAIGTRVEALQRQREELAKLEATWQATLAAALEQEAPPALLARIRDTIAAVQTSRDRARDRVAETLEVQGRVADLAGEAEPALSAIAQARAEISDSLLQPEQPPLWDFPTVGPGGVTAWAQATRSLRHDATELIALARRDGASLAVYGLLTFALLPVTYALRTRSRRRRAEGRSLGSSDWVFEHPLSIAVLATLPLLVFVVLPDAPIQLRRLILLLSWIPIVLVLRRLLPEALHPWLLVIASFYLLDRVRDFFEAAPFVERWLYALELGVAVALLVRVLWPSRLRKLDPGTTLPPRAGWLLRGGALSLGAALVANVLGFVDLSRLLGEGVLVAAYAAVVLFAVVSVLRLVFAALLRTGSARRLRVVQSRHAGLERRFARLVVWAGGALWFWVVLTALALTDPVVDALRAVLGAGVDVGNLDFSVGDVVLFGLIVWLSLWVSRILRAVLDDEVFSRAQFGRGLPQTISTLAQYAVLIIGLLIAASTAGFDWSRIALVAGALGVGIGFGLQNVVNNFISGLILLFERPIQVGDTVQQGELVGEVRRIGIRSSTVRTWQGAEVIVPNADLISQQVVNWTLSDRQRRIDLAVGVAYGTDPERVLPLLREVAAGHPEVLDEPAPLAVFSAFGESSLDFELRIWTVRPERMLATRSELMVAIHAALRDAGIEIPFPQRDLHVVSVRDEAVEALEALAGRPSDAGAPAGPDAGAADVEARAVRPASVSSAEKR